MGLRELRLARRLSQRDLAYWVGVREATLSAWENGKAIPYPRHRKALAYRLGVSEQELGFDEGERERS